MVFSDLLLSVPAAHTDGRVPLLIPFVISYPARNRPQRNRKMEPVELGIDMTGAGQMYDATQAPAPAP